MESKINFFEVETSFQPSHPHEIQQWIGQITEQHQQTIAEINYIFVSDDYLHRMNVEQLGHDYLTDIITFPYQERGLPLHSDIYISIDRVRDNAETRELSFEDELHRVMIHGVLHLCGYDDHSDEDKEQMRNLETEALNLRLWMNP